MIENQRVSAFQIDTCVVQVDNDILKWLLKGAIAMMTQVAIGAAPAIAALTTDR